MQDNNEQIPNDKAPDIRVLAMPADTNAAGDIFGGWLMSQADIAGSIEAIRHAGGRVVTVAVNNFTFIKPVYVGDLVSLYARLIKTGRTSLQVEVEAFAQRQRREIDHHLVAKAEITYVAVDADGHPRPVNSP